MLPSARRTGRRRLLSLLGSILILSGLLPVATAAPVLAAPTELFISEYIEGSSNNKAIEIFNGTGATVNLAASDYEIKMAFNGNPIPALSISLTGSVAAGDVYVLTHASATLVGITSQSDQSNGAGWFNGDDAILLTKADAVIDSVGQAGVDPGTEWGTGLTSTADNTLRRKAAIQAGDTNGSDAFDPSIQWDGFAQDSVDGLGSHTIGPDDTAPTVANTFPVDGATDFPIGSNISVTFSESVNALGDWFTLECSSGPVAATASGGPTTFTINPTTNLVHGDECTLTVLAANITDSDGADPPDNMVLDFTVGFTAFDVCANPYLGTTAIPDIQGDGPSAAITGNVTTAGVVVGAFDYAGGIGGFYLQDPVGDGDATTSDGIFVFTNNAATVAAGEVVRVSGFARERFTQTVLNGSNSNTAPVPAANIVHCGVGDEIAPATVEMPFASSTYLERFEGMLTTFPQDLVIAEFFNYDQFGEIVLALPLDGEDRPFTGTAIDEPGAAANARTTANSLRRITLDDNRGGSNPETLRHPNGDPFTLLNRFRGGDRVANATGVLGWDFNLYRVFPTAPADHTSVNPRPEAPDPVGGTLRAAAMNTLNFFLTPDAIQESSSGPNNPADDVCGPAPFPNLECRGWDGNQPLEFDRQRDKLLRALAGLDADVIGLNELENTTGVEPLLDPERGIVAGLNELGVGTYAAIDTGVIGTDAIRVGLIYRTDAVVPVGAFEVLDSSDDPRFIDTRSRPVLAQTFEDLATGARFTVAVNHLKSKGSACADIGDPDLGDGQGNCNQTREAAAQALVDWLATDPTGSGDRDFLILGDLNSYAQEDPIDAVKAGADDVAGTADDYTDLIAKYQGAFAHSYVFDGQAGYLDHALASATLVGQVTGATDWHINSDEPDVVDYDTSFKGANQEALYEDNPFRSSDHDPVIVGLNLLNYEFDGFLAPVDDAPTLNLVKAGQGVPVKFRLSGDLGLDVLFGAPTANRFTCDLSAGTDVVESTTSGISGLQYDPVTNTYTYVWKTDRTWAGQCRTFEITFDDGSYWQALFSFTR